MKHGVQWLAVLALVALTASCSDSVAGDRRDSTATNSDDALDTTVCTADRDGWQHCDEDQRIKRCHVVTGLDPHHHLGHDCAAQGLSCRQVDERRALCVDATASCSASDQRCESNVGYQCLADGALGVLRCGTAKKCVVASVPECKSRGDECGGRGVFNGTACECDEGYTTRADNLELCVETPERLCKRFGAQAFTVRARSVPEDAGEAQIGLDSPYRIELPEGSLSYAMFPIFSAGDYQITLDRKQALEALLDEQDAQPKLAPLGANSACPSAVAETYEVTLSYDRDDKRAQPVRLRFATGAARTVRLMVSR